MIEMHQQQDVSAILNGCKILRDNEDLHTRRKEEFKEYCRIPLIFIEKWMHEYGIQDFGKAMGEIMFKKVNTDFTYFKTTNTYEPGKIRG